MSEKTKLTFMVMMISMTGKPAKLSITITLAKQYILQDSDKIIVFHHSIQLE